jgi:hypothetical protein
MSEILLNKFEKRDLVIKLHKEGKTYREICHIAHVSPRDIKPILKKYEQQKRLENNKSRKENAQTTTKKLSLSSQAFTLFKDGKKPSEVKILLDIPFKRVMSFWKQYLKSIGMEDCYDFYQVFQNDLSTLLPISNFMKRNNIFGPDIVKVLGEAYEINTLHQTYSNLKTEVKNLEQRRMYLLSYSAHSNYSLRPLPLNKPNYGY